MGVLGKKWTKVRYMGEFWAFRNFFFFNSTQQFSGSLKQKQSTFLAPKSLQCKDNEKRCDYHLIRAVKIY